MNTYTIGNIQFAVVDNKLYQEVVPNGVLVKPVKVVKKPQKPPILADNEPVVRRGFSPEEKENIYELYRRGEKPAKIAKLFKCKPAKISMLLMFARKNGVNLDQTQPTFDE